MNKIKIIIIELTLYSILSMHVFCMENKEERSTARANLELIDSINSEVREHQDKDAIQIRNFLSQHGFQSEVDKKYLCNNLPHISILQIALNAKNQSIFEALMKISRKFTPYTHTTKKLHRALDTFELTYIMASIRDNDIIPEQGDEEDEREPLYYYLGLCVIL